MSWKLKEQKQTSVIYSLEKYQNSFIDFQCKTTPWLLNKFSDYSSFQTHLPSFQVHIINAFLSNSLLKNVFILRVKGPFSTLDCKTNLEKLFRRRRWGSLGYGHVHVGREKVPLDPLRVPGWVWKLNSQIQIKREKSTHIYFYVMRETSLGNKHPKKQTWV